MVTHFNINKVYRCNASSRDVFESEGGIILNPTKLYSQFSGIPKVVEENTYIIRILLASLKLQHKCLILRQMLSVILWGCQKYIFGYRF